MLTPLTGANNGIGYETVTALAQQSETFHILLGSRTREKGEKALQNLHASHGDSIKGTISVLQLDVTDPHSIAAAKDTIEAEHGKLDVLINNAGIIAYGDSDLLTALRTTFETNVFGTMLLTETLVPLLQKSALHNNNDDYDNGNSKKAPYIIYVSSSQGSITSRLDPAEPHRHIRGDTYRMSKAALNMLAACHRFNFDPRTSNSNSSTTAAESQCKIKVLAFNPGWCVTDLTGAQGREMRAKGGARSPRKPADALVEIVLGKRDADVEKNGMMDVDGHILPW